ncbi:unnamed protein product [Cuscuta campestris]|uniref:Uncharacterized protein n=1 Tax=Cuscuta campestris TaxID=132261 RepID=A0A484NT38_9ASTE|nr:unnamed protein product [Cuscuta campestris]
MEEAKELIWIEVKAKRNKIDKLGTWLLTHEPKKGSKLDDISAMKKELILKKLDTLKDVEAGAPACDEVFEKGSKANQSDIIDLTVGGNTTTEKSHDEDRWNKDDEAESDELEDVYEH